MVSAALAYDSPTIEAWARTYIESDSLEVKRRIGASPSAFARAAAPVRIEKPGRPRELRVTTRAPKSPGPEAIRAPEKRAMLLHSFWHHELQAAELMAWAILAFPDTPASFRRGLLKIARDETRHMALYEERINSLGYRLGDFPVRDWFWERVPSAKTPEAFVAVMGIGFEGGNLDHAARFADRFRNIGDEAAARAIEIVGREEIPHVRFAVRWFSRFTGVLDFEAWRARLPAPLSPIVMRGAPLNRAARRSAGLDDSFVDALERYEPS